MIQIREVSSKSKAKRRLLKKLHEEIFGDEAPELEYDDGYYWIAYTEEKVPIGLGWLTASKSYSDFGYLARCGVMPGHRGQGLQRRFICVREEKARKLGWRGLVTDTTDTIYSANNLIREGFLLHEPLVRYAFKNSLYWKKSFT